MKEEKVWVECLPSRPSKTFVFHEFSISRLFQHALTNQVQHELERIAAVKPTHNPFYCATQFAKAYLCLYRHQTIYYHEPSQSIRQNIQGNNTSHIHAIPSQSVVCERRFGKCLGGERGKPRFSPSPLLETCTTTTRMAMEEIFTGTICYSKQGRL